VHFCPCPLLPLADPSSGLVKPFIGFKMSKDPAVLFYTSDFLSGTQYFSDEECGQYIRLLCQQHQLFSIPEKHLLKVCGSLICQVALKFIKDTDGTYYNERMRLEGDKRKAFCQSRRNSVENRYVRRSHVATHVSHTNLRMEDENEDGISTSLDVPLSFNLQAEKLSTEVNTFTQYPEKMRLEFISYWTEPNRAKTKIRAHTEKTWDTSRRLATWASRDKNFIGTKKQFGRQEIPIADLQAQMERIHLEP
jgi:hypothetical protein